MPDGAAYPKTFSFDEALPASSPRSFSFDDALPPAVPTIAAEQGMPPQSQEVQPGGAGRIPASISRIAQAALAGGKAGWDGAQPLLTPKAQAALDEAQARGGVTGGLAKLGSILADDFRLNAATLHAVMGAVQAGVAQTGAEAVSEPFGRDIAAMPEAFMGMPGALRAGSGELSPGSRLRIEPTFDRPPEPPAARIAGPEVPAGPRPGGTGTPRVISFEEAMGAAPPPAPTGGVSRETSSPPPEPPVPAPPAVTTRPEPAAPPASTALAVAEPAATTPTEAAPVQPPTPETAHGGPWTTAGKKNHIGDEIYENPNGVRAIFDNGVPWTESVTMDPERGMVPRNPGDRKQQFRIEGDSAFVRPKVAEKPRDNWTMLGTNAEGLPVYANPQGVHSVVVDGVRDVETVRLRQTPGGMAIGVPPPGDKDPRFRVVQKAPEVGQPPETPPAAPKAAGTSLTTPPGSEAPERPSENVPAAQSAGTVQSLDPATIHVDAPRFQFKSGGDEAGVTDRLAGVTEWNPLLGGTALVWRDEAGNNWIADGHQRLGLAQRLSVANPDIRINAFVLDSKNGITDADARAIAAAKNIAEGTGSPIDAAKVIRESAASGISLPPLPPRSTLVRDGEAIAKLGDDAFGMAINEVVPVPQAAIVGRLVSDPLEQAEAMRVLAKAKPDNARQAEMIVRDVLEAGTERMTQQGGLFGDEAFASSPVLERARVADEAVRQLARDRTTFKTLVGEAERIEGHGANRLDVDANRARLTDDEQARQLLTSLATTRGPVSDALTGIARRVKSGDVSVAAAAREFLGTVRAHVAGELGQGSTAGSAVAGAEPGRIDDPGQGGFAGFAQPIDAYHGTPHEFDAFDTAKIGTGEGVQAYGHGLYFAQSPGVARSYQTGLTLRNADWQRRATELDGAMRAANDAEREAERAVYAGRIARDSPEFQRAAKAASDARGAFKALTETPGNLLTVRINAEPEEMLDWDRPISEQSQHVQEALKSLGVHSGATWHESEHEPGTFNLMGPRGQEGSVRQIDRGNGPEWLADYSTLEGSGSQRFPTKEAAQDWLENKAPIEAGRGADVYRRMQRDMTDAQASAALSRAGIKGIRYLDQGNRAANGPSFTVKSAKAGSALTLPHHDEAHAQEDLERWRKVYPDARIERTDPPVTHNIVVFDHHDIEITHRNGEPVRPQTMTAGEAGDMLAEQGERFEQPAVVYRRAYQSRDTDGMRLFDRDQRVIEAPDDSRRAWRGKPWVIETPTKENGYRVADFDHYATREEAEAAAGRREPDANERAAYEATRSPKLVDSIQAELQHRGFDVRRDDASTTNSKYLYVRIAPGHTVKVRFSDHSKTVFLGTKARNHSGDSFDFSTGKSRPDMVATVASLFRTLEDARVREIGTLAQPRRAPLPPASGPDLFGGNRPAPTPRSAEPTIRNDPAQATMPGMGPSAVQAQAARDQAGRGGLIPRGEQQKADEGLFARPEAPTGDIFARTSRWPNETGFQDHLAQFPAGDPHTTAADWVFQKGRETGNEWIAVVHNPSGDVIHAGTSNLPGQLPFRIANTAAERDAYTVHHNHPNGGALSLPDIAALASPGISHVVAHGHNGQTYIASIGPAFRDFRAAENLNTLGRALGAVHLRADAGADVVVIPLYQAGKLTRQEANQAHTDVTNRLLDAAGATIYQSTFKLPQSVETALQAYLKGRGYEPDVIDRSTRTLRPGERVAGLPRAARDGTEQGRPGGAGGGAASEAVAAPSTQGAFLQPSDPIGRIPLYSPTARAVDRLKQARGTGPQMLAMIEHSPGVKPEEMQWLGLRPWLWGQKSVTKDQIADYVRANALDVREVVRGKQPPLSPEETAELADLERRFAAKDMTLNYQDAGRVSELKNRRDLPEITGAQSRYSSYTLPGGSNYRELLITLPEKEKQIDEWKAIRPDGHVDSTWVNENAARSRATQIGGVVRANSATVRAGYRSPHWEEPNVLAHLRFDERTAPDGKRVLLVHEAQSDWMQSARKKGMIGDVDRDALHRRIQELTAKGTDATPEEKQEWADAMARLDATANAVPAAPFRTTWPALVMKRAIKWAVDNGFDRVAWAPGDVQADRYDLSKQVSALDYKKNPDGTYRLSFQKDGRGHIIGDAIPADKLEEQIGKDVAQKIVNGEGKPQSFAANNQPRDDWNRLSGLDLKVGGDGMRTFYDKILPAEVNKIAGKYGGKVGASEVGVGKPDRDTLRPDAEAIAKYKPEWYKIVAELSPLHDQNARRSLTPEGERRMYALQDALNVLNGKMVDETHARSMQKQPVHSVDITPQMRDAVADEGLGLFQPPERFPPEGASDARR